MHFSVYQLTKTTPAVQAIASVVFGSTVKQKTEKETPSVKV